MGIQIKIIQLGPSRYPALGDCPCGHGSIRTVSKDGYLLFFECGLKVVNEKPCGRRFTHKGGKNGVYLCGSEDDNILHDFGKIIEINGQQYFESHLKGYGDSAIDGI